MNNDFLHSDLLVQYIDGELSAEENNRIENALKDDEAMQQELNNLRLAKNAIKAFGTKQKVATIHKEMMLEMKEAESPKKGLVRSIIKKTMQIAASLFIVVVGVAIYQYSTVSSDKLFDSNYQPYSIGVSRAATDADAMEKAFQSNNYAEVLNQFKALSNTNQKQNFFAGHSYLANKDYGNAINCFNKVVSLNSVENKTILKDDAEYYLALSYLKSNNVTAAKNLFTSIYNNKNHLYNDKVSQKFLLQLKLLSFKN